MGGEEWEEVGGGGGVEGDSEEVSMHRLGCVQSTGLQDNCIIVITTCDYIVYCRKGYK